MPVLRRISGTGTAWRILLHRVQESTMFIETESESFGKKCHRCLEHSNETEEEEGTGMTDREKAIVTAYTGLCMLAGDKFQIFHKYVEDIMGRPIWTHEIGLLADEIKGKSEADFMSLCADESSSEKPNKWIPITSRPMTEEEKEHYKIHPDYRDDCRIFNCKLPDDGQEVLISVCGGVEIDTFIQDANDGCYFEDRDIDDVDAWMPLPTPYQPEIPTGAEGSEE